MNEANSSMTQFISLDHKQDQPLAIPSFEYAVWNSIAAAEANQSGVAKALESIDKVILFLIFNVVKFILCISRSLKVLFRCMNLMIFQNS